MRKSSSKLTFQEAAPATRDGALSVKNISSSFVNLSFDSRIGQEDVVEVNVAKSCERFGYGPQRPPRAPQLIRPYSASTTTGAQRLHGVNVPSMNNFFVREEHATESTPSQFQELYHAKCQDLKIKPKEEQGNRLLDCAIFVSRTPKCMCLEKRFYEFCTQAVKGRKYIFRDCGFGLQSCKVLQRLISMNKISHLDLRKNYLGNDGLQILVKGIKCTTSLVHIDIGSNDITFQGANFLFTSITNHSTLCSVNIANSDGLHRNRIGTKGKPASVAYFHRLQRHPAAAGSE